jgi:hypothetical protein
MEHNKEMMTPLPPQNTNYTPSTPISEPRTPQSHLQIHNPSTSQPLTSQPLTSQPLTSQPLTSQPPTPQPPTPQPPTPQQNQIPISNINLTGGVPPPNIPLPPHMPPITQHHQLNVVQPPNIIQHNQHNHHQQKDIEQFKQICKQWLALNDDIKKLQQAIKVRRQFQNELTPKMMVFMKEKQIEDLDTGDGKLKYTISNRKVPLNKDNIQKKLTEYFKDQKQAESVATYIMENRDIVKAERLSRTMLRKKNPKIDPKSLKL